MKKIFISFLIIFCCACQVLAGELNNTVKFEGKKFTLLYSAKSPEHNGFINEYFKQGESYDTWSEMIAIHHFPNVFSPISQTESFRDYLNSVNCPSAISIDEENNTGMIDFILIDGKKMPIILEFNVFKYEKSPGCGTKAVQYARRYCVTNSLQVDEVKKSFEKYRKQTLKDVKKFKIPETVNAELDAAK